MSAVDDYLSNVTPEQKRELERVREIAKKMVPEAEEVISYGVPTLKYKGTYLLYFAAFKNHMSVFPGGEINTKLMPKLSKFKVAKGTIQFTADNPLPESLIKELVNERLKVINSKKS